MGGSLSKECAGVAEMDLSPPDRLDRPHKLHLKFGMKQFFAQRQDIDLYGMREARKLESCVRCVFDSVETRQTGLYRTLRPCSSLCCSAHGTVPMRTPRRARTHPPTVSVRSFLVIVVH